MRTLPGAALVAASLLFAVPGVHAHGDLHNQIAEMDRRIAAEPKNAALVLRRAELHRIHREWKAADADYAKVLALQPRHPEAPWLRARASLEAGNVAAALPPLDRYVALHPAHAGARLTRARALAAAGLSREAAAEYALAIARLPDAGPDHFVEWVNAQRAAAMSPTETLATLDHGLRRLGAVPALEALALDIDLAAGQWDDALRRIDRQVSAAARKEFLLFKRGQILERAGRHDDALAAYRASLAEIDKLPATLRGLKATGQLVDEVQQAVRELDGSPRPAALMQ